MSEAGHEAVTPELALVDPVLAPAQRQAHDRKVTMSSTAPEDGMLSPDRAQPAPAADLNEELPAPPPAADSPPLPDAAAGSPQNVPLGTLIFRAGLVAENQLEEALEQGMRTGKRLGEVLLERGWLNDLDLGRMLALQKGLEFVQLAGMEPDPDALRALAEEKARLQTALPLRFEGAQLVVAVADPSNELMLENLRRSIGHEPLLVVAAQSELKTAIGEAYAELAVRTAEPAAPEPPAAEPAAPAPQPADPPPAPASPPAPESSSAPSLPPEVAPPAPEPMPTVLPPPEERSAPSTPAAPPAEEQPPLQQPVPVEPLPAEPEPISEPALQVEPVTAPQEAPPAPTADDSPVEPSPEETVAPEAKTHSVVLRLRDGEEIQIGSYATGDEARLRAEDVVREVCTAEGEQAWPFFAERFLRPDTIVSVDIVEHGTEQWAGSSARTGWASETP
jgi:MshEN domain